MKKLTRLKANFTSFGACATLSVCATLVCPLPTVASPPSIAVLATPTVWMRHDMVGWWLYLRRERQNSSHLHPRSIELRRPAPDIPTTRARRLEQRRYFFFRYSDDT